MLSDSELLSIGQLLGIMKNGDLKEFTDSEEKGLKTVYNNFEEETAAKNNIVK